MFMGLEEIIQVEETDGGLGGEGSGQCNRLVHVRRFDGRATKSAARVGSLVDTMNKGVQVVVVVSQLVKAS